MIVVTIFKKESTTQNNYRVNVLIRTFIQADNSIKNIFMVTNKEDLEAMFKLFHKLKFWVIIDIDKFLINAIC